MNVIEIATFGGPEVLRLARRPIPTPGPGQVRIRVSASGINRPDVLQRSGLYPVPAGASDIPGLEVAGIVTDGDAQAMARAGLNIGDRVCALVEGGGYAEQSIAQVGQCLPVPKGLSDIEAASLPETVFTVWSNVFDRGDLKPGETLLVHGGSSGIGVMAIQIAKALGAYVIVTAGSDEKCNACLALGADYAINYKTQDFETETLRLTEGRGADVILDMVAGVYVSKNVNCMAVDGRLLIIAVQGGVHGDFNVVTVMRKRLTLTGSTLRARLPDFKMRIAKACLNHIWPLLEQGVIKPVIHSTFPALDERDESGSGAALAHRLMESNLHIGKIVLTW